MRPAVHKWFWIPRPRPDARVRLICLPPAGGDAPMFGSWADALPPEVELWAAQLPGRGRRIHEAPLRDAREVASTLAATLAAQPAIDTALFGGSLGGFVAFEMAHRLAGAARPPRGVFVYGSPAPHLPRAGKDLEAMSDVEFAEALRKSSFLPEVIVHNKELLAILLPALRADHVMAANYQGAIGKRLAMPIHVFFGRDDALVDSEAAEAWRLHAGGSFSVTELDGGHLWSEDDGTQKMLLDHLSRSLCQPVGGASER